MNRIRISLRLYIAVAATIPAITALAGNTTGDSDTNPHESVNTVVANTLHASGYTTGQCNSFTRLIEQARQGDKLAYETLANYYRYGEDVTEKCMLNAIFCYQLAGSSPIDIGEEAFNTNPNDEFGLLIHLMDILDKQELDSLGTVMKSMEIPDYKWANLLKTIARNAKSDYSRDYILSLVDENSSGDEFFVALASLHILTRHLPELEATPISLLMAEKVPYMYNLAGEKHWDRYKEDKSANKENLDTAIMYFRKADVNGFLSPRNARRILSSEVRENADISKYFGKDDIARLVHISGIVDEDNIDEPDVVEMDMNPVERIEDSE